MLRMDKSISKEAKMRRVFQVLKEVNICIFVISELNIFNFILKSSSI